MTRTQQAVTLREQGLNISQIAEAMGTSRRNVQNILWHADNIEWSRQYNREASRRRRLEKAELAPRAALAEIRKWWAARGY